MPFERQSLIPNENDISEASPYHLSVEPAYEGRPQDTETVTDIQISNWSLATGSCASGDYQKKLAAHDKDCDYNNVDLVAHMYHEATASLFRSEFRFDHINGMLSTDETFPAFPSPEVLNYPHRLNPNNPKLASQPIRCIQWRAICPWPGCLQTFARYTDVDRHIDSVHYGIRHHCTWVEPNGLPCRDNNGSGYCRLEKLNAHQRQKHGILWNGYS